MKSKVLSLKFLLILLIIVNLVNAYLIDNNDICFGNYFDEKGIICNGIHKYKCDNETCTINKMKCLYFTIIKNGLRTSSIPFLPSHLKTNIAIIHTFLSNIKMCVFFEFDELLNRSKMHQLSHCSRTDTCFVVKHVTKMFKFDFEKEKCGCKIYHPKKSYFQCSHNSNICAKDLKTCDKHKNGLLHYTNRCDRYTKTTFRF